MSPRPVSRPIAEAHHRTLVGRPFAKYVATRRLGAGGMGTVFEARHARLGSRVAIKVLASALSDVPELVTRFEREARVAGALTSPHAVKVIDIDVDASFMPFIVMELLEGEDLSMILEREGPQPVDRSVRWVLEACHALAEAHDLGVVHRDIKPSNLFLANVVGRSIVKVLDFGVAKLSTEVDAAATGAPLGTPQYMAPEQVRCARDVDARADVWALGVSLYELVTGEPPFAHECPCACIAAIAADPVPDPRTIRPDLPETFVNVLMKALAKDPAARWASVRALVEALAPFAGDEDFVRASAPAPFCDVAARAEEAASLLASTRPAPIEVPPVSATNGVARDPTLRPPLLAVAGAVALCLAATLAAPSCAETAPPPAATSPRAAATSSVVAAPSVVTPPTVAAVAPAPPRRVFSVSGL